MSCNLIMVAGSICVVALITLIVTLRGRRVSKKLVDELDEAKKAVKEELRTVHRTKRTLTDTEANLGDILKKD